MIKFITKPYGCGSRGYRDLDFDVNITINHDMRKDRARKPAVRIGLRNDSGRRLGDSFVALAYDEEQMILYIIPKRTLPEEIQATAKFYTVCGLEGGVGTHVKTTSEELLKFIENCGLTGFNNLQLDTKSGWFMIKKSLPEAKFI